MAPPNASAGVSPISATEPEGALVRAATLAAVASYADVEDMLVCMTDDEGNKARQHHRRTVR